jgi:hypothetical protein
VIAASLPCRAIFISAPAAMHIDVGFHAIAVPRGVTFRICFLTDAVDKKKSRGGSLRSPCKFLFALLNIRHYRKHGGHKEGFLTGSIGRWNDYLDSTRVRPLEAGRFTLATGMHRLPSENY